MSERRRGLGRGLGALIPSAPAEETAAGRPVPEATYPGTGTAIDDSPGGRSSDQASGSGKDAGPGPSTDPGDGADRSRGNDNDAGADVGDAAAPGRARTDRPAGRARQSPPPSPGSATSGAEEAAPETPAPVAAESEQTAGAEPPAGTGATGAREHTAAEAVSGTPAAEGARAAGDGRSAAAGRGRTASPAARQKAMKARMDMGEAFRGTSLGTRPSDMFFQPSAPAATAGEDAETSALPDEEETSSDGTELGIVPERSGEETKDGAQQEAPRRAPEPAQAARAASGADVSRETLSAEEDLAAVPGATFAEVPVEAIHPNRKQPRQVFDEEELAELAYSIGELGVLQPIVVRPSRESGAHAYELVMGERRWRAAQRAGLAAIPAIVRETTDDSLLRDALLENLHRSQLNPLEEAAAYQQLMEEFGATQEELSRRIGRSRPQISNTIRLLRLPPLVQRRVAAGVLSSGHARALLSLTDPAAMERLAQRIVAEGLSVRATEEAVQLAEGPQREVKRATPAGGRHQERLNYIADAFADRLDTSVKIALGARKGKMTIEFASVDDLNRIIEVLDPGMDRQ